MQKVKEKIEEMDKKKFRVVYDGTWEEGDEHIFPVRELVVSNGKSEWVDVGHGMFPSYKYINGKMVETYIEWDGEFTCIFDIIKWVKQGVPEWSAPDMVVDLYWLWGKQRYHILKDKDLIFFWKHVAKDARGFTEIIAHSELVRPLCMLPPAEIVNEQLNDEVLVNFDTPSSAVKHVSNDGTSTKETDSSNTRTTSRRKTPGKKGTRQAEGDPLFEECNINKSKKLAVKRKIPVEEQVAGKHSIGESVGHQVNDGEKDTGNEGSDGDWNIDDSAREEGVWQKPNDSWFHEDLESLFSDEGCNVGSIVDELVEKLTKESRDLPQYGSNVDDSVEDLTKDADNLFQDDAEKNGNANPQSNTEYPDIESNTVEFLGKIFNLDQLDASDEEYLSGEDSEEEEKAYDEEFLKKKEQQTEEEETSKPVTESYKGDDNDGDFIMKTHMLEEDEEENKPEGLRLEPEMTWVDKYKAREHLVDFAVENRFTFYYYKNDSNKLDVRCKKPPCKWRAYITMLNDGHTMECKSVVSDHTCEGDRDDRNSLAKAPWIASKIMDEMRMHHKSFTPHDIVKLCRRKKGMKINILYWQAWHVRILALERIFGNYEESYGKVPELCRQILLSNPCSLAACARDHLTGTFKSLLVCFKASLDGFLKGCRPLIGIDGCFLKGKYGGACLTMIGLDGNNGMFPIAFYICLSEDLANWKDFLQKMHPYITRHNETLTIMSDRQKGLTAAVAEVFPDCFQRFCFRHMVKNLRTKYRGCDHIVWAAARAFRVCDFDLHMEELKKVDKKARNYMDNEHPGLWARAFFNTTAKSDHNTNNFKECFNSYILEARDMPIVTLVMKVMTMLMKLICHRNKLSTTWDESKTGLVPRVEKQIEKLVAKRFDYKVTPSSPNIFKVEHELSGNWFTVDLTEKTCGCYRWQLTGIPCVHCVLVLYPRRLPYIEYTHEYFTIAYYKRAYEGYIRPVNHESEWSKDPTLIMPPIKKKSPGRNRKQRRIDAYEAETTGKRRNEKRCSRCGMFGHNITGCTNEPEEDKDITRPVQPVVSKKGGRPKSRPERLVWDAETGQTRVLPTRGQSSYTAYERAQSIAAVRVSGRGGAGRGQGRADGNRKEPQPAGRGAGRGQGRGAKNQLKPQPTGRGAGRGQSRRAENQLEPQPTGRGAGRGHGRGAGRGVNQGEPQLSQPSHPSTPQPIAPTPQPQTQPTPPQNPYTRPGQRILKPSSRLAWLLGVDNEGPDSQASSSQASNSAKRKR